jgi:quercetin dioxygenase-like cupin family protein
MTSVTTNQTVKPLLDVPTPVIPPGSDAMMRLVEVPPGDPGLGPHRHSGPVFGYVVEGEILFELEGEAPYKLTAGQAFSEPGGDVIHYQAANLLPDRWSRFVVCMICAPGVEMLTMVGEEELAREGRLPYPVRRLRPLTFLSHAAHT